MRVTEYSYEDAREKSKKFLKDILGTENYYKIIKDGFLEIKSKKNVYELHLDGRVINKTTNQKYCIVPNRPDYPNYDVIAIKYAWLRYGVKTVERVANKSVLLPPIQRTHNTIFRDYVPDRTIGYDAFVHYMEENGWYRERLAIDESNNSLVTTLSVQAECTGAIAQIKCPIGRMITVMGINQVPAGRDLATAYSLTLYIKDEDGNEIHPITKIRINKVKPTEQIIQLCRCFYSDFSPTIHTFNEGQDARTYKTNNELWRWRQGVALYGEEYLDMYVIDPEITIRSENVKIEMECDLWMR